MQNKNRLLLAAAALFVVYTAPVRAQTSNGILTWYIYVSGGDDVRGDLVVQTSNVLTTSVVYPGPPWGTPLVMGYPVESISGTVLFGSPAFAENVTALLPPGSNGVQGCGGVDNQEGEVVWNCTTANMTVDNLIVPNMNGHSAGLDGAGLGFASLYVNNNAQPGQIGLIDDVIQLYSLSGQPYMLDLGVTGGPAPVSITISSPEPETLALMSLGLLGIWLTRGHRRRQRGESGTDAA